MRTRAQTRENAPSLEDADVRKGWDHWLIIRADTVTKKELKPSEYLLRGGKTIAPYWFKERLRNEAATLDFVRANTTIPVPESSHLYEENGLLCLETSRITSGRRLISVIAKSGVAIREAALKSVDVQIKETILPQLQKLRRNTIGSVDESIPVFPPPRVYEKDRREWPRIASSSDDYVLCHTCFYYDSIFVDPETYKIVGVLDWECAGYFPSYFEQPTWRDMMLDSGLEDPAVSQARELAFFGLTPEDLHDDSTKPRV